MGGALIHGVVDVGEDGVFPLLLQPVACRVKGPGQGYLQKRKRTRYYNVKGSDSDRLKLLVSFLENQKHLPVVNLRKVG